MTDSPAFQLGQVVSTPGALDQLRQAEIISSLRRHAACDWGDVCDEDRQTNNEALEHGLRLFSVYHSTNGVKFWIITEADRSSTCVLLPEEY